MSNVYASVWDAIEDTPTGAANMKLRSTLMQALQQRIKTLGITQTQAAAMLHVSQPRISDLMRGKIDLFGIDALIALLAAAGLRVDVNIAEAA